MMKKEVFFIDSSLGYLKVSLLNGLLYSLSRVKTVTKDSHSPLVKKTKKQLEGYFSRKTKNLSIPLFERGTSFQKKVWRELQKIPYGKTITYKELAQKIGRPKGARAVGGACAKNPFLIVVPCHRVVAQNHLGGFALGIKAKKILLKGEGHLFE